MEVEWDNGGIMSCRWGEEDKFDLTLVGCEPAVDEAEALAKPDIAICSQVNTFITLSVDTVTKRLY